MTEMDLQEQKKEIASGLNELTVKEILMVHGVVQGFKMARKIAAEDTAELLAFGEGLGFAVRPDANHRQLISEAKKVTI